MRTFQMARSIDAVDPMVLSLKRQVEGLLAQEAQFRFDICVSEALSNLVLHSSTPLEDATIKVTLSASTKEVVIDLFDPEGAAAFDLRDHAQALSDVDEMAEGGRGLGLILECADEVTYGALGQQNRLSLAFRARG